MITRTRKGPLAANDAQGAELQHGAAFTGGIRDLFSELEEQPAAPPQLAVQPPPEVPSPALAQMPAPMPASELEPEPDPPAAVSLSYAEAQRLMAIGRAQGPQALTPVQHRIIWDCLQELPESQAWLAAQLQALQGELQERGMRPWQSDRAS